MTHEHMDYLLDNGYTDDANRLADHQFATGLRMSEWFTGDGSHLPRVTQAGLEAGRMQKDVETALLDELSMERHLIEQHDDIH